MTNVEIEKVAAEIDERKYYGDADPKYTDRILRSLIAQAYEEAALEVERYIASVRLWNSEPLPEIMAARVDVASHVAMCIRELKDSLSNSE